MRYFYRAKNLKGEIEQGFLEAAEEKAVAALLKNRGYFLLDLNIENGKAQKKEKPRRVRLSVLTSFFKVPLAEKLFFTRNLMIMLKSGLPLPKCFEVLSRQARNQKFKQMLSTISAKVIKGEALSAALADFEEIFPRIYQETVRVGEETGKLTQSLEMLAEQMAREHELRSKVKTAMVYPLIVVVMAVLIGIFMFLFAVPKLKQAFDELGVELPFSTQLILNLGDFLSRNWLFFVLFILIFIFAVIFFFKLKKGSRLKSLLALKIPILSSLIRQTNSVSVLRSLSALLSAGVPVVRAMDLTGGTLGNFYFRDSMQKASLAVEKGKRISASLKPYQALYSSMVLEMLEIGEETGETSQILRRLADFYEAEVTRTCEKLSAALEPILIVFIGAGVGFFAVSMMQPLFSGMGNIK